MQLQVAWPLIVVYSFRGRCNQVPFPFFFSSATNPGLLLTLGCRILWLQSLRHSTVISGVGLTGNQVEDKIQCHIGLV